jgi:hypothetical protein
VPNQAESGSGGDYLRNIFPDINVKPGHVGFASIDIIPYVPSVEQGAIKQLEFFWARAFCAEVNQSPNLRTNFSAVQQNRFCVMGKIMNELSLNLMQPPSKLTANPLIIDPDMPENPAPKLPEDEEVLPGNLIAGSIEQGKTLLNEHKGKLAIGVAATLGLMVFYKWREKKLAEEDPEEYARLQRIKAVVREEEANGYPAARLLDEDK